MEFQPPKSFEELKALIKQFEVFLPEENREVIWGIINEIESTGGDQEKIQEVLQNLMEKMGMNFK